MRRSFFDLNKGSATSEVYHMLLTSWHYRRAGGPHIQLHSCLRLCGLSCDASGSLRVVFFFVVVVVVGGGGGPGVVRYGLADMNLVLVRKGCPVKLMEHV